MIVKGEILFNDWECSTFNVDDNVMPRAVRNVISINTHLPGPVYYLVLYKVWILKSWPRGPHFPVEKAYRF